MEKPKILIIDDEPLILKSTSMILELNNFTAITANDGFEGLKSASENKPDLILLDVMMPGMSGWDVLTALKKDEHLKDIPVVIFTAKESSQSELEQFRGMYCEIITKPFRAMYLVNTLNEHLK